MRFRFSLALLVSVALAGCGAPAATTSSQQSGSRATTQVRATRLERIPLTQLVTAPIPARNLYQLTDQLKLRPPRTIAHIIRTVSPNFPVGHQDPFEVLSEDENHYFILHATIEAETPHLYIYVQNGMKVDQAKLQQSANTFENHIYPTDRAHFGSEWRPGVDGDPHITLLLGNLRSSGAGGFYSAEDEYPRLVNPYSNQREMIYLNSIAVTPGDPVFDQTMAHEFQHMIHWHMHPHDNAWLNEGMSMLAEDINRYTPVEEPAAYLDLPDTQIDSWSLNGLRSAAHYGAAYLYLAYLYDRFGSRLIREMLADSKYTDFRLVNDALAKEHINQTADGLFKEWVVANVLRDSSIDGGVYGYSQVSGPMTEKPVSVPFTSDGTSTNLHPYAVRYIKIDHPTGTTLHLSFAGPRTVPLVHLMQSGPFWWGNRGDMSATTLERPVDLTHVRRATLHFLTSYDIEKDYDYTYVEASADGGKTWTTLRGEHTTTSNPNGASYGNAYTGNSHGEVHERIDLSRYAGRRILLRFQYVTDDEYTGEGMALRAISIPEIGWHDDFTGWKLGGFVPVFANSLPASWHVQLIASTSHGPSVSDLPLHADQGATTLDPATMGLKKLVVAIYFASPKTTVPSPYRLSITR